MFSRFFKLSYPARFGKAVITLHPVVEEQV
jgi:hypothetical protein